MCVYLFSRKNRTCAGLLGTVRLLIKGQKECNIEYSSLKTLFCNATFIKFADLIVILIHLKPILSRFRDFTLVCLVLLPSCALIWACAFIFMSTWFQPVCLFRSVRLFGSRKYTTFYMPSDPSYQTTQVFLKIWTVHSC